jgi:hypothetical protein
VESSKDLVWIDGAARPCSAHRLLFPVPAPNRSPANRHRTQLVLIRVLFLRISSARGQLVVLANALASRGILEGTVAAAEARPTMAEVRLDIHFFFFPEQVFALTAKG